MPSILGMSPYPWFRPEAQQLHDELTRVHPTGQAAEMIAAMAGLDTTVLYLQQAPAFVWKQILDAAAPAGLTRALVQTVRGRLHPNAPLRPFLDDLLAGRPTATYGETRAPAGAPAFLTSDDEVTDPEALLYQDDLTIEIGRVPGLIETLRHLVALGPAVCKLTVDVGGEGHYGTAFRIGADRLLTNWHVVHRRSDGARAIAVTAEFGFEDNGRGGGRASTAVPCDVTTVVGDQADDWAVIQAAEALRDEWPTVPLSGAATPTPRDPAFVIQHPLGQRKRVGIVRNQISYVDDRVVHYLTDTQTGSSGAPVLDASGRLVAVHHAGGRPQQLLGKPPLLKNEGIRIPRILDGLAARGVPVA